MAIYVLFYFGPQGGAQKRSSHIAVESLPVATSLQCRDAVGKNLHSLAELGAKIDLQKFHKIVSPQGMMESDDFKENVAKLKQLSFHYDYESDSSEEEDWGSLGGIWGVL